MIRAFLSHSSKDKDSYVEIIANYLGKENIVYDIDLQRSETVRRMWPFFRDRRIDSFEDLTKRWRDR